jgi:hypothetical protein
MEMSTMVVALVSFLGERVPPWLVDYRTID